MADAKQKTVQRATQFAGREPYEAPKLRVFGAVSALTQSGSNGMGEYDMMNMVCRVGSMSASDMC